MIVFSDLDGTLLDHATYSFAPALPALARLAQRNIPLVLVTSKTRAEVEALRLQMGHTGPFIVENGAAAILPSVETIVFGSSSADARTALARAAATAGATVRGFGEMTVAEIAERAGLPPQAAALAARREYGEPFLLVDGSPDRIAAALAPLGFQLTRGGRFFHVLGGCDKARAVAAVADHFADADTAGLGDAPNDIGFLSIVQRPIIVPSAHLPAMREALPQAQIAPEPGPAGWNRAVLDLLAG